MLWYSWILFLGLLFHSSGSVRAEGQEAAAVESVQATDNANAVDQWGPRRFFGPRSRFFYGGYGGYGYPWWGGGAFPYVSSYWGGPFFGGFGLYGRRCTIDAFGRTICVF